MTMYLMRVTNKTTGKTEMVIGEYPNQRDAQTYAVLHSVMVAGGGAKAEDCDAEIVSVTTQESRIMEWVEQYR